MKINPTVIPIIFFIIADIILVALIYWIAKDDKEWDKTFKGYGD